MIAPATDDDDDDDDDEGAETDPEALSPGALFDKEAATDEDDINLTCTGSISEFLLGLDQLDEKQLPPTGAAIQRIASYASFSKVEATTDAASIDSGSDTESGSFSTDTALPLSAASPKEAKEAAARSPKESAAALKDTNRKEWAAWEDEAIRSGVQNLGTRWRQIAAELPGRSDDAVRNRWARLQQSAAGAKAASSPRIKREGGEQRQSWTEEEDGIISDSVREFGHRWNRIAERLPRRTEHAIRNRWHRIQMREEEERASGPSGVPPAAAATVSIAAASPKGSGSAGAASVASGVAPLASAPKPPLAPTPLPGRVMAPSVDLPCAVPSQHAGPSSPPPKLGVPATAPLSSSEAVDGEVVDGSTGLRASLSLSLDVTADFYMDMDAGLTMEDMLMEDDD